MDYAPNFNDRYKVRYIGNLEEHSFMWRSLPSEELSPGDLRDKAEAFLEALGPLLSNDFTPIAAEYSGINSSFFLPAPAPGIPSTLSATTPSAQYKSLTLGFTGRTANGHPARFWMYGANATLASATVDWTLTSAENANVLAAIAVLNSTTIATLAGIDGYRVTWYPRVRVKFNDHWVGEARP